MNPIITCLTEGKCDGLTQKDLVLYYAEMKEKEQWYRVGVDENFKLYAMKDTEKKSWKEEVEKQYLRRDLNGLLYCIEDLTTQSYEQGKHDALEAVEKRLNALWLESWDSFYVIAYKEILTEINTLKAQPINHKTE